MKQILEGMSSNDPHQKMMAGIATLSMGSVTTLVVLGDAFAIGMLINSAFS